MFKYPLCRFLFYVILSLPFGTNCFPQQTGKLHLNQQTFFLMYLFFLSDPFIFLCFPLLSLLGFVFFQILDCRYLTFLSSILILIIMKSQLFLKILYFLALFGIPAAETFHFTFASVRRSSPLPPTSSIFKISSLFSPCSSDVCCNA